MRSYPHFRRSGIAIAMIAAVALAPGCGSAGGRGAQPEEGLPPPGTPRILQVVPYEGDVAGGELVTIIASSFQDDFILRPPIVYFGSLALPVTVVDTSAVEVVTPPCPVGSVDLVLDSAGSLEFALLEAGFTYVDSAPSLTPQVLTISPDVGETLGGEVITISTADFRDDFLADPPRVFIGMNPAVVAPVDSTTIQVLTPPHAAGVVDVQLRTSGFSQSVIVVDGFSYSGPLPPPPGGC